MWYKLNAIDLTVTDGHSGRLGLQSVNSSPDRGQRNDCMII